MPRHRKSSTPVVPVARDMTTPANGSRQRITSMASASNGNISVSPTIKTNPPHERAKPPPSPYRGKMTASRAIAVTGITIHSALPALISWGVVVSLIFGGCCSNVFALEAIVKKEPESGLLITFVQFIVTALFTLPSHFSASRPPTFLKPRSIPLVRWIPAILLYFTISMMNNFAFGYDISVPVHIILRSGGSVTTMLIGFAWGKRYNRGQVLGVVMLTAGVVIAALSDAQAKGKTSASKRSSLHGLAILFVAQILSSVMGIYIQRTYDKYGGHWKEYLFYSHFISLPLFVPFFPVMISQLNRLAHSQPMELGIPPLSALNSTSWIKPTSNGLLGAKSLYSIQVPSQLLALAANALTQYACISGVNLLGTRTTALGVTIVLNIRKLVSLFASIWLFGNRLPIGVMAGASVVFIGAGVYGWAGSSNRKKDLLRRVSSNAELHKRAKSKDM